MMMKSTVLIPILVSMGVMVSGKPYTCSNKQSLDFVVQMCAQHEVPALSACLLSSPTHVMSKLCACANPEGSEEARWYQCLSPCWPLLDRTCYWHVSDTPVFETLDPATLCPTGTVHSAGHLNDPQDGGSSCGFPGEDFWSPPTPPPPAHPSGIVPGSFGENALMKAAKFGLHTVVADMLEDPDVLRTIDGVNNQESYSPRTSAPYSPNALHYAIVGWFEKKAKVPLNWYTSHPSWEKYIPPIDKAPKAPKGYFFDVNYTLTVQVLIAAGASPLAGRTASSPLHLALDVGLIEAVKLMVPTVPCAQLAYGSYAHVELKSDAEYIKHQDKVNLVHVAAGSMWQMANPCRSMLRAQAQNKDEGAYRLFGLTLKNTPSIKNGICRRDEVFDAFFKRFAEQLTVLAEDGFKRCKMDTADHMDEYHNPQLSPLAYHPKTALVASIQIHCDPFTARVLLKYGADPFAFTEDGPIIHLAAQRGCHQVVGLLLDAALIRSKADLHLLSQAKDKFGRAPGDVALDRMSKCYLKKAKLGLSGASSGCKAQVEMEEIMAEMLTTEVGFAKDVKGTVAAIVKSSEGRQPKFISTGWRAYTDEAPLMRGMKAKCDIVELDTLISPDEFYKRFQSVTKPVIFRGGALDWPAMKKWTPDYLAKKTGEATVKVSEIPYGDLDGYKESEQTFDLFLEEMLFDPKRTNLTGSRPPNYVFSREILARNADLITDVKAPYPFESCQITSRQLIVGPEGSGAPVHFHTGAFNAAIYGRKRWFLYPQATAYWSRKPSLPWLMEGEAHKVAEGRPLECIQEPGDVMYVPHSYGHAVLNMEDSVAVAMELEEIAPEDTGWEKDDEEEGSTTDDGNQEENAMDVGDIDWSKEVAPEESELRALHEQFQKEYDAQVAKTVGKMSGDGPAAAESSGRAPEEL